MYLKGAWIYQQVYKTRDCHLQMCIHLSYLIEKKIKSLLEMSPLFCLWLTECLLAWQMHVTGLHCMHVTEALFDMDVISGDHLICYLSLPYLILVTKPVKWQKPHDASWYTVILSVSNIASIFIGQCPLCFTLPVCAYFFLFWKNEISCAWYFFYKVLQNVSVKKIT